MTYKLYLSEREFDRLDWDEQKHYRWCEHCQLFWNTELLTECNHGR